MRETVMSNEMPKDVTRVLLFAPHGDGLSICDIWEIELEACEALPYLRGWHAGDASHFIIERGYVWSDGSQFFPWRNNPRRIRADDLSPIGRLFHRYR